MEVTRAPGMFEQHEIKWEKATTLEKAIDSKTAICLQGALSSTLGAFKSLWTKMNRPTKGERQFT